MEEHKPMEPVPPRAPEAEGAEMETPGAVQNAADLTVGAANSRPPARQRRTGKRAAEGGGPYGAEDALPDAPGPPATPRKRQGLPDWARFLIKLGLVAGLLALAFTFVLGVYIQRGNRMHPYVGDGDLVIYYRLEEPKVNDLVIYRHPNTGSSR